MRRVLLGDIIAACRILAGAAPSARAPLAQRLITEADAAHRYMKRFGRPHPQWGSGTLEARAHGMAGGGAIGGAIGGAGDLAGGAKRSFDLGDPQILAAMAVLAALLARRRLSLPHSPPMC